MATSMLGFSARMAAGKTVVSKSVAAALDAKRITFGGVVTQEAIARGIDVTREALQDLGQSLVDENVAQFCLRALESNGWIPGCSIVIDGVRHVRVLETLREMVEPDYFGLMYLNIDRDTQLERWKSEDLVHSKPLEELERHPTEIEVLSKLPQYADLVLNGKLSVRSIVEDVLQWSRSNFLVGNWKERNDRRVLLAGRAMDQGLTEQESEELSLLQTSFGQYLAIQFDPYQVSQNPHQQDLDRLESRYRLSKPGA